MVPRVKNQKLFTGITIVLLMVVGLSPTTIAESEQTTPKQLDLCEYYDGAREDILEASNELALLGADVSVGLECTEGYQQWYAAAAAIIQASQTNQIGPDCISTMELLAQVVRVPLQLTPMEQQAMVGQTDSCVPTENLGNVCQMAADLNAVLDLAKSRTPLTVNCNPPTPAILEECENEDSSCGGPSEIICELLNGQQLANGRSMATPCGEYTLPGKNFCNDLDLMIKCDRIPTDPCELVGRTTKEDGCGIPPVDLCDLIDANENQKTENTPTQALLAREIEVCGQTITVVVPSPCTYVQFVEAAIGSNGNDPAKAWFDVNSPKYCNTSIGAMLGTDYYDRIFEVAIAVYQQNIVPLGESTDRVIGNQVRLAERTLDSAGVSSPPIPGGWSDPETLTADGQWSVLFHNPTYGAVPGPVGKFLDQTVGATVPLASLADGGHIGQSVEENTIASYSPSYEKPPRMAQWVGGAVCAVAIVGAFFVTAPTGPVGWALLVAGGLGSGLGCTGTVVSILFDDGYYRCDESWTNFWGKTRNDFVGDGWTTGVHGPFGNLDALKMTSGASHENVFQIDYGFEYDLGYHEGKKACETAFIEETDRSKTDAKLYKPTAHLAGAKGNLTFTVPLVEQVVDIVTGNVVATLRNAEGTITATIVDQFNAPVLVIACDTDCPVDVQIIVSDCGAGEIAITGESGENVEYNFAGSGNCFALEVWVNGNKVISQGIGFLSLNGHFAGAGNQNNLD